MMVAPFYKYPTKMNTLQLKNNELKKKIDEFNKLEHNLRGIEMCMKDYYGENDPRWQRNEQQLKLNILHIANRLPEIKNEITVLKNEISVLVSGEKKEKIISLSRKFNLNESEAEAVLAHLDYKMMFKIEKNTLLALQTFNTFAKKNGIRVQDAIQVIQESLGIVPMLPSILKRR